MIEKEQSALDMTFWSFTVATAGLIVIGLLGIIFLTAELFVGWTIIAFAAYAWLESLIVLVSILRKPPLKR